MPVTWWTSARTTFRTACLTFDNMTIALSGFMGCGKSSVGRELQGILGWPLTDLDEWIETQEGRRIKDIFSTDGEGAFREMELSALREITSSDNGNLILSLGGGTLTTPQCEEIVRLKTVCFYLSATADTLVENLLGATSDRPMLCGGGNGNEEERLRSRISSLMASRLDIYLRAASHTIVTDGKTPAEIAGEIVSFIQK